MATSVDPNHIQSLVIFNEIIPEYCIGDDIDCRFYVDPSLDTSGDKIGLYPLGWTHKQDFIAIKEVKKSSTDEFDEKTLVFSGDQLDNQMVRTDVDYQFCYFHPFGDNKLYRLCGRSNTFRFYESLIGSPEMERKASPSAPELSVHYPTLDIENLVLSAETVPKRLFIDGSDEDIRFSTPKGTPNMSRSSSGVRVRFEGIDDDFEDIKDIEINDLKTRLGSAEERIRSLESELKTKEENENKFEDIHNELIDTIRVTEAKNISLEEQLSTKDNLLGVLEEKCSSQEVMIAELKQKLSISQSELDLYQNRSLESIEREEQRHRGLNHENRLLRDKLQEVMEVSERLKQSNDRLIKDKTSYQSVNELLTQSRRRPKTINIEVNEMSEDVKDICIRRIEEAMEQLLDMKSMADFIVYAMDNKFGECWHCFIGQDFTHNSLLHVFGTYISLIVNGLKFVIYKTNDLPDSKNVIQWAKHSPRVKVISKSKSVDKPFETMICKEVMASIDQDFEDYRQLSGHLSLNLRTMYGINCRVICGETDRFDGSPILTENCFYIELNVNYLKVIVIKIN